MHGADSITIVHQYDVGCVVQWSGQRRVLRSTTLERWSHPA